uniref:Vacuolar protein sorting-associated protein 18 homolog n=1 Tax=Culicoides sonorensis TaxID=179676 RepID=A0A336LYU9_CULSO
MASIFDQYENTLSKERPLNVPEPPQNVVTFRTKEQSPIFSKQKLNLSLKNEITCTCINNNWLIVLMSNQLIFRLNLADPKQQDDILIEKFIQKCAVNGMYIDPLGLHIIVALGPSKGVVGSGSPGILYLQSNSKKPRIVSRFKDHCITAVAFNWDNKSETNTGLILLGTSKGLIFEADIGVDQDRPTPGGSKPIFDIDRGDRSCITGLKFFRAPGTNNYIVLVATPDRLYKFYETIRPTGETKVSIAQQIFAQYLNIPENLLDLLGESVSRGNLSRLVTSVYNEFPKAMGWLTETGVLYLSDIDRTASTSQFISSIELIPIPEEEFDRPMVQNSYKVDQKRLTPRSLVLTDYHVMILFNDCIRAVSLLNYQTVYEEQFTEQQGKLLDLMKDATTSSVFLYTTKAIYRYKITREDRNVWQLYLDKNEFSLALSHCQDNPAYRDIVLTKHAEDFYEKRDFIRAAKIFAETQKSFEEVCLKFYEQNQNEALLCYLNKRFEKLKSSDKTQITMLTVWIIELYLTQMSKLPPQSAKFSEYYQELDKFMKLPRVSECVRNNRPVVQELISSHGDIYDLTTLKHVNPNQEVLLQQFISQENFFEAIQLLKSSNKPELVYKYSPVLIEELPNETVAMFKKHGKRLDGAKLIPSLICINSPKHIAEVIDYLEFCIHSLGNTEQSLNNYLILLYATYRKEKLVDFLKSQGEDRAMINYDIYFALRTAKEHDVKDALVYLYCMLNLWQKAIELALTFDVELAQQKASQVKEPKLKKRLWLLIAKNEIESRNDVNSALELVKKCELLRLEDILPFFSDFDRIDDFKQTVCDALKDYEIKLQEQKRDMDDSVKSAETIRKKLENFRNRSLIVSGSDICAICETTLFLKPFFLFPCSHKFHSDCMEKEILANLSKDQLAYLNVLKIQLTQPSKQFELTREQIKEKIEETIASNCLLCGETMIESLDKQFDTNWDEQL